VNTMRRRIESGREKGFDSAMRLTLLKFCLFRFIHEGQARCERLFRHHLVVYYAYWMGFFISVVFSAQRFCFGVVGLP